MLQWGVQRVSLKKKRNRQLSRAKEAHCQQGCVTDKREEFEQDVGATALQSATKIQFLLKS